MTNRENVQPLQIRMSSLILARQWYLRIRLPITSSCPFWHGSHLFWNPVWHLGCSRIISSLASEVEGSLINVGTDRLLDKPTDTGKQLLVRQPRGSCLCTGCKRIAYQGSDCAIRIYPVTCIFRHQFSFLFRFTNLKIANTTFRDAGNLLVTIKYILKLVK